MFMQQLTVLVTTRGGIYTTIEQMNDYDQK